MDKTLLNADIFFFITSISVILFTALMVVVLIYVAQILKDLKHIVKKAREETDHISEDISELRKNIKKEGVRFRHWLDFFAKLGKKSKKKPRK